MKVLHLIRTAVGATWALRQIRELVHLGVEIDIALPEGEMGKKYAENGATVHICDVDCKINEPFNWTKRGRRLKKLVNRIQPDIVHSHFVGTTLAMRIGLRSIPQIPRIFQVPGPLHLEHLVFRRFELMLAQPNDHWIASCEWTQRRYQSCGVPNEHIFLSYYGVDIDDFKSIEDNKLRRELELADDEKVVGIVAFMYAPRWYLNQKRGNKGHEDLIDAVAICRKRGVDIKCIMIGGAWGNAHWYEEKVKQYARKKCDDSVIFLGSREDVPELYPGLDVVVHPSHSENVGGAVESLLLARPTITTDVGGFPDLIKDGKTGYLVPSKNPKILAKKIEYVLNHYDEAEKIAANGRKLCREMFDIRKNAYDVYTAYKIILNRN
jgi:glycosyltransferase involved in cell wall biosynthesis